MKLSVRPIHVVLEIMGFVGMIIGDICEKRYLMYICGFMCSFFSTCLYIYYVQRVKYELDVVKFIKTKKETNQYGCKGILTFMAGCCLSALFCKMNIKFGFLILLGVLLGFVVCGLMREETHE